MNKPMIHVTPMITESHETGLHAETEKGHGMTVLLAPAPPHTPTAPLALPSSKGFVSMLTGAARDAKANKGLALWQFVRFAIAATYFWVGGTFLFGGDHVHVEPTYHLIENLEGGVRVHGLILFMLAFLLSSKPAFKRQTEMALLATLFYSLVSTFLICGGWVLHKPDLSAPAWYFLITVLCVGLIVSFEQAKKKMIKRPSSGGSRA